MTMVMKKETAERRNELFTIRMSVEERERLEEIATREDAHAGDIIRDSVNEICRQKRRKLVFRVKA